MRNLNLDDVNGFTMGFKPDIKGLRYMHYDEQRAKESRHREEELRCKQLADIRKSAIVNQMAHYLITYCNEIEFDGYFMYNPDEQACFFWDNYDAENRKRDICIPMWEFVRSSALQIIPNGEGYRDDVQVGNIAQILRIIEDYVS